MPKFCLKILSIFTSLFLGLVGTVYAQLETVKVTDSIHIISGKGGNIGVFAGEDGTFMIDDKFPDMSEDVSATGT